MGLPIDIAAPAAERPRLRLRTVCLALAGLVVFGATLSLSPVLAALAGAVCVGCLIARLSPSLSQLTFWLFVAVLVTAVPGPNLELVGGSGMLMAFRLLLGALLLLLAGRLALRGGRIEMRLGSGPALLWLPILGWAVLSLLWCDDPLAALRYLVFLAVGVLLIFAIREYSRETRRFRLMVNACAAVAAGVILFGIFERVTDYHLPASVRRDILTMERVRYVVTSVFRNPNEFATYIALWVPVFFAAVLELRSRAVRLLAAVVCMAGAYCLTCTGSRANLVALALAAAVVIALSAARRPVRASVALALLAVIGVYGVQRFLASASRHQLGALSLSSLGAEAGRARAGMMGDGLALLAKSWGVGVGAGNVEGHMADLGWGLRNVHNWWLEILVDLGVIAFVCYAWFYFSVMLRLYRQCRASPDHYLRAVSLGLLAGMVGFTIGCVASSSLIAAAPIWIYLGLCVGAVEAGSVVRS